MLFAEFARRLKDIISGLNSGKGGDFAKELFKNILDIDDNEFDLNTVQADRPFLNFRPTNSDMTVIIPEQPHGIHNIELYTTVEISGSTLKSDSLFYEIAWRDPLDETPVI